MAIKLRARYQGASQASPPIFERTFRVNRVTIGNDPGASLCLNGSVSIAEQVVIEVEAGQPTVLNQAEGTSLNGEPLPVNSRRRISNGDLLNIGTYEISVFLEDESAALAEEAQSTFTESPNTLSPQPPAVQEKPTKSFAAILDSLRTDEDRFYFVIEGGRQAGIRVPIENEETPVGWDKTGEYISFDVGTINDMCGVVHKDWSGVTFQTHGSPGISVNNEPLQTERRLRDGDRVSLNKKNSEAGSASQLVLVFREPASLVILDSLMPRIRTPLETGPAAETERDVPRKGLAFDIHQPAERLAALIRSEREYFGVFTFVEISLMTAGTIVGAIIIFLILNYS